MQRHLYCISLTICMTAVMFSAPIQAEILDPDNVAALRLDQNQLITCCQSREVVWDSAIHDNGSMWDGASAIVIPAGYCWATFDFSLVLAAFEGEGGQASAQLQKNTTGVIEPFDGMARDYIELHDTGNILKGRSAMLEVVPGDVFTLWMNHNDGGGRTILPAQVDATWLSVELRECAR